jgi:uncharacterized protein with NAD-binding domain and iron-sulfur cluster
VPGWEEGRFRAFAASGWAVTVDGHSTEMGINVSSWVRCVLGGCFCFCDPGTGLGDGLVFTFVPTIIVVPSADQERVNASPPTSSLLTQVLERTSQKRTVPSVEQLASSASRTGLKRTFSMPAVWPRNSVE